MKRLPSLVVGIIVLVVVSTSAPHSVGWAADGGEARADRYYQRAVHFSKRGEAALALENYELALPYRNETSDIFFNLVQVSEAGREWRKVLLYGQGFLYLEPQGEDATEISAQLQRAKQALSHTAPKPQPVSFEVPVEGARVFVNEVGVDPNKQTLLMPGRYDLRVAAIDFKPYRDTFTVVANAPTKVTAVLQKIIYHGKLRIVTEPADAVEVFIDDKQVGITPLEPMTLFADQRYLVRFEKDGWDSWLRYVTIPRDETFELAPKMEQTEARLHR